MAIYNAQIYKIDRYINLSIYQSIYLFLSLFLSFYLSIYLSIYLSLSINRQNDPPTKRSCSRITIMAYHKYKKNNQ